MNLIEQIKKQLQTRKRCKQLVKDKMYDQIYIEYGYDIYYKYVPRNIRRQDAKQLFEKGEWLELYAKHRYDYNSYLPKMREIDVISETGCKQKGIKERMKYKVKKDAIPIMLSMAMIPPYMIKLSALKNDSFREKNERIVEDSLDEYNEYIQKYAEIINSMNLTDFQILVKIMFDIAKESQKNNREQNSIQVNEYFGYERLYFYSGGKGVCRHKADDMVAKLNVINPDFNARVVNTFLYSKEESLEEYDIKEKIKGNHAVVAVDITTPNCTLILDPEWKTISVLDRGKIKYISAMPGYVSDLKKTMVNSQRLWKTYVYRTTTEFNQEMVATIMSFVKEINYEEITTYFGQEAVCQAWGIVLEKESIYNKTIQKTDEYQPNVIDGR